MTLEDLDRYKNMDFNDVNISDLDNIDEIDVDDNKEVDNRVMDFLDKVKNPYFFNINGFIVKFTYKDDGLKADECIENVMKHII